MHTNNYLAELQALAAMSNRFGADPEYVLAGGGNTSFKSNKYLWIKGSGTALATIQAEDFVSLERTKLSQMWDAPYPEDEAARESAVLADMMAARIEGEYRRPSVETLLHDLFPERYVLHVHPAIVNGLTCSKDGQSAMEVLFPDALWVKACKPGYMLALECKKEMDRYRAQRGKNCTLLFLQNHGVFFAGNTTEETSTLAENTIQVLQRAVVRHPDLQELTCGNPIISALSSSLSALYGNEQVAVVAFFTCPEILRYDPATKSLSPDHIVYAKAKQLQLPLSLDSNVIANHFHAFTKENGYKPKIVFVQDLGMFSCGSSLHDALTAQSVMLDAIKVVAYAESFGGVSPMRDDLINFIIHWEAESYRSKVGMAAK